MESSADVQTVSQEPAMDRKVGLLRHVSFLKRDDTPMPRTLLRFTILCCLLFDMVWCEAGPDLTLPAEAIRARGLGGHEPATMCRAHSHNDYHQADPLSSALKYGLKSIEVDVFPRNCGLWVAHTVFELTPTRTIDNLYIQPILGMFQQTGASGQSVTARGGNRRSPFFLRKKRYPVDAVGSCPRGGSDIIQKMRLNHPEVDNLNLLVDFKGDAEQSASLLQSALAPLRPYMSRVDKNGKFIQGKLTVLISGNRPTVDSLCTVTGERFMFLDGRLGDVYGDADTTLVPMVSIPWRQLRLARAFGRGESYMRHVADKAHAQGKLVRIWGVPNRERFWSSMVRSGIDLLSIDDHAKFARFVSTKQFGS